MTKSKVKTLLLFFKIKTRLQNDSNSTNSIHTFRSCYFT
jgi:hypothetical protein